ncbi:MAG TPA: LLM class flavin-dependent oxidoreductase [Solirubrobacteraceae bacterium]|nr:LLM class flavin-dependent oxidoreductase [Solirubrobacteraceae bacterium]
MTRLGVLLPTFDAMGVGGRPPLVQAAQAIEQHGFDAAWVGDHLHCPAPGLDAPTALAAAAAVTERVALGFSVMLLGLRQPAWAAKQLTTIDVLSGGRLVLGVGVGGEFPQEYSASGVPLAQRGRRLDQVLEALPHLLTGQPVHLGRGFELDIPALAPAMAAPPPLFVGGRGEAALRRAARFGDAWLPMWLAPEQVAQRSQRLAELAEEHRRPRPKLALLLGVHVDEDAGRARRAAADYIRGQYGMDFARVEHWTGLGEAERIAEQLEGYLAVGVEEFVLMPLTGDPLTQIARLAEVRERLLASMPVGGWTP